MKLIKKLVLASIGVCALAFSTPCKAIEENFYSGKQISIFVEEKVSSYTIYGQLISRHFGNFLRGNPTVSIAYIQGATGPTLTNYLYEDAPRDGTVLAVPDQELGFRQARHIEGLHYNAAEFTYVGRIAAEVSVHMAWHTTGVSNLYELKHKTLTSGAIGLEGNHVTLPNAQNQLLGLNWKITPGYRGNSGIRLALERGEIEAGIAPAMAFNAQLKPWLNENKVNILVQYAEIRHHRFPNVPQIVELAENPEHKALFQFLVSVSTFGRALVAPPGLSKERTDQLRNAFQSMVENEVFQKDAERMGADLSPMRGEDLAIFMDGVLKTPPEIVLAADRFIHGR